MSVASNIASSILTGQALSVAGDPASPATTAANKIVQEFNRLLPIVDAGGPLPADTRVVAPKATLAAIEFPLATILTPAELDAVKALDIFTFKEFSQNLAARVGDQLVAFISVDSDNALIGNAGIAKNEVLFDLTRRGEVAGNYYRPEYHRSFPPLPFDPLNN